MHDSPTATRRPLRALALLGGRPRPDRDSRAAEREAQEQAHDRTQDDLRDEASYGDVEY